MSARLIRIGNIPTSTRYLLNAIVVQSSDRVRAGHCDSENGKSDSASARNGKAGVKAKVANSRWPGPPLPRLRRKLFR